MQQQVVFTIDRDKIADISPKSYRVDIGRGDTFLAKSQTKVAFGARKAEVTLSMWLAKKIGFWDVAAHQRPAFRIVRH